MQKPLFRGAEIFNMALRIEHQGIAFYRACTEVSPSPRIKEVFDFLIKQEEKHIRIFGRMKEETTDTPLPESYPGELHRYTDAFVKDKVFFTPEKAAEKARSIEDPFSAIDWAIGFERHSIAFYNAIKKRVRKTDREAIDRIIQEEERHIERLAALKKTLDSQHTA